MSALGQYLVTLADVAKENSGIGKVAEVLTQENPMLMDIPYMEMNEGTIHKESIRSGLPDVYYRKANQAIPASKSTTEERTYSASHFESKSQMDEKVANRGGKLALNRWNQAMGHIQAMGQEHADLTIYGSPESSNLKSAGLMDVYSSVTASDDVSAQMINGGGSGSDNTSILLMCWGENSIFGVYPKGTRAGLQRYDRSQGNKLVQINALDVNGNAGNFWGYEEQFEIDHGLVVKDYRQGARVCNIDVSNLVSGAGAADLIDLMISAYYKIHNLQNGQPIFYVNRTIQAILHKQSLTKVGEGAGLTYENYQGKPILSFLGIPIRRSDALLNTEAAIV